jgi:hypothetical protein
MEENNIQESRARAHEAEAQRDALRARCAELERAKDDSIASPEAFEGACDALAQAQRDLDRAERAAVRAHHDLRMEEQAQARIALRRVLAAYHLSLDSALGAKVKTAEAALVAFHGAIGDLEGALKRTSELSEDVTRLASACGESVAVLAPSDIRARAFALYLNGVHARGFVPANLRQWLITPPPTLEDLAERLADVLCYPTISFRFRDLEMSTEQRIRCMLNGTFYAELRERQAEEKRRIEEQAEERREEQRAAFESDVANRLRAGAADLRTARDQAIRTLRHDAAVVLAEAQP